MPAISAKVITPKKKRYCASFFHTGIRRMEKGIPQMRLYGNVYICLDCANKTPVKKVLDALSVYNKSINADKK